MSYMLNGVEVKVGQVWESPSGYKVKVIAFTSEGKPAVEYVDYGEHVSLLTNPKCVLVPEKKVLKYQVFKNLTTGKIVLATDQNGDIRYFSSSPNFKALSPILEYEYTDE